jgi:hypothetical protein
MTIQDFENLMLSELKKVVERIIIKTPSLPIAVRQGERQGDAISKFLESAFVDETYGHSYLGDSKTSPTGKTKNPYDVETFFHYKDYKELIWIDFKAVNIDNEDSNPDSGTPDKIITLIQNGGFYLAYIFVFYQGSDAQLSFVENENDFVKAYFLKDISPTVRITPANQLQVNYSQPPQYRTREAFINFLAEKKKESFERRFKKAQEDIINLNKGVIYKSITIAELLAENERQENNIKKL